MLNNVGHDLLQQLLLRDGVTVLQRQADAVVSGVHLHHATVLEHVEVELSLVTEVDESFGDSRHVAIGELAKTVLVVADGAVDEADDLAHNDLEDLGAQVEGNSELLGKADNLVRRRCALPAEWTVKSVISMGMKKSKKEMTLQVEGMKKVEIEVLLEAQRQLKVMKEMSFFAM